MIDCNLKAGKQQAYELGQYLRQRYGKLIGSSYSSNDVYIYSTDTDRTLMTAQCAAAGLFPPTKDAVWNEKLNWQPIPLHSMSIDQDKLLIPLVKCPRYRKMLSDYEKSPEIANLFKQHEKLLRFMEKNSGKEIRTLADILLFRDVFYVERLRGFR